MTSFCRGGLESNKFLLSFFALKWRQIFDSARIQKSVLRFDICRFSGSFFTKPPDRCLSSNSQAAVFYLCTHFFRLKFLIRLLGWSSESRKKSQRPLGFTFRIKKGFSTFTSLKSRIVVSFT